MNLRKKRKKKESPNGRGVNITDRDLHTSSALVFPPPFPLPPLIPLWVFRTGQSTTACGHMRQNRGGGGGGGGGSGVSGSGGGSRPCPRRPPRGCH